MPEYPRDRVNEAGKILKDDNPKSEFEREAALIIINNWRTCHNFPLNTFQVRLRTKAKEIDPDSLVAQRIKRLISIKLKLNRFPNMKLTQMQDIGGCRAIVSTGKQVDDLVHIYKHGSRGIKHNLATEDDYILKPKDTGYRGVHLVYKYKSDKNSHYEGLKIEIQIRTKLQHAWATAVETVDTFTRQSLKSSQGQDDWLRFFELMGSAMAIKENKPLVPNTPIEAFELKKQIIEFEKKLSIIDHLHAFRTSIKVFGAKEEATGHYYLLELDVNKKRMQITTYGQNQLLMASENYLALEKKNAKKNVDTVLVSVESLSSLKMAFPNYYLDTELFLKFLHDFVRE